MRKYIVIFAIFVLMSCPCFAEVTAPEYVDNEQKIKSVPDTLTCLGNGYYSVKGEDGQTYQFATKEEEGVEMVDHFVPIGQLPADIVQSILISDYLKKMDELKNHLDSGSNVLEENKDDENINGGSVVVPEWVDNNDDNGNVSVVYIRCLQKGKEYVVRALISSKTTYEIEDTNWSDTVCRYHMYLKNVLGFTYIRKVDNNGFDPFMWNGNTITMGTSNDANRGLNRHYSFWTNSPRMHDQFSGSSSLSSMEYGYTYNDDVAKNEYENKYTDVPPNPVKDNTDDVVIPSDIKLPELKADDSYFNVRVVNVAEFVEMFNRYYKNNTQLLPDQQEPIDLSDIDYLGDADKNDSWIVKLFKAIAKFLKSLIVPDDVVQPDGSKVSYLNLQFNTFNQQLNEKIPLINQCQGLCNSFLDAKNFKDSDVAPGLEVDLSDFVNGTTTENGHKVVKFIDFTLISKYRPWLHDIILFCAWFRFIFKLPRRLRSIIGNHSYYG